jgi:PAS domain S-box-containing protein
MRREKRSPRSRSGRTQSLLKDSAALDNLLRSEAKYRRLHETRIDAFASVSLDGHIEECNELFQQMVGYTAEELRGLRYQDLTPVKWHAFEAAIIEQQVLVRGHSEIYEKEYRRKDGTIFPVELRAVAIRNPVDEVPVGMWAVVRDISERKEAERRLIESREALADAREALLALINSTTDLIWSVDPQKFGLIIFNEGLREYFAKRGIHIRPGMTPSDLLPPDFAARWCKFYERVLRDGPFVEQYITASKRPVLLLSFSPVRRGNAVSAIAVFGKDITERIQSEEALRVSEERFRQVAESVSDFIWEVNAEGLYTYTNPAVEQILGYTSEELVGKKHFYDLFAENVREELKNSAFRTFAAGQAFRGFSNVNVAKDGRLVHLETSGVPILDEAGKLLGYRGADTDVTERRMSEQALRDLSGKLINAQEEERLRLAREIHDDFCQRLALLAINTSLLGQSPPASIETLQTVLSRQYDEINALANDAHRMSHDLHPARLEQLGLGAAMGALCRDLATAHELAIAFEPGDLPPCVPPVLALCLYRVTQEALQNVVKHSGATTANVELTCRDGDLCLVVRDDGVGFDVAAAERTATLGLANMRERVRSISGRFSIACAPGEGTRIEVCAPLQPPGGNRR